MIAIESLDHLVLTVADSDRTVDFYCRVLGMQARTFGENRTALHFGTMKINLHLSGHEFEPKARNPCPGSADLCFLLSGTVDNTRRVLSDAGVEIEQGPVRRTGASGPIISIYLRDPDENLIELGHAVVD